MYYVQEVMQLHSMQASSIVFDGIICFSHSVVVVKS